MDPHLPSKTGTPFFRTCLNGVNTLAGLGMLSIPYALSQGGWLSLVLLTAVAIVCCYTGLLLQRCMDSNMHVRTYPDVGELAFGSTGRIIVSVFMYLELYLVAIEFLILEGDNLHKLFPHTNFNLAGLKITGKQGFVLITALIILPTTWLRNLGVLAYVSVGGVFSSLVLVCCVLWAGGIDGVGFHGRGTLIDFEGIPTALSLFAFCYSGHAVFPTIYSSMKDRTMFPKVLFVCFTLCTLNYGLMAVVGYLMYGQAVNSQVTLNLPVGKLSSKIAIYTTLITPLTKYALVLTPIANSIEDRFHLSKLRLVSILIRTLLVVSTVMIALTVPFFGYVVALTGSFLSSTATMLLPCLCYIKIFRNRRQGMELVTIVLIIAMGASIAVIGTYSSIKQIVDHI
ncbi:vacuolar amino acid transporter 1-like [Iris pallida]|uniref:Vacuolar amino acid transporter 1-like n=1 Tax=Iris pallida TaxID=29817 RepID=A0AAX6F6E6_IRIPA|nr:vacuolar amino acid transporter 1-like [Iris pallida]KAJ6811970.1 vacuolar amino acid transporter 1-like [Iris pallida]